MKEIVLENSISFDFILFWFNSIVLHVLRSTIGKNREKKIYWQMTSDAQIWFKLNKTKRNDGINWINKWQKKIETFYFI